MNRLVKQAIIGGFYLAIIFGVVWFFYRAAVPAPSCTDGIQNGGEEGVDCGATSCGLLCPVAVQPLKVEESRILKAGNGYDVLTLIENPNPLYGASRVDYSLTVTDASGAVMVTRRGNTYVNPLQPRYMVFPLVGVSGTPTDAVLQIDEAQVEWSALTTDAKGDIQFGVRDGVRTPASDSMRFEAAVLNRSRFDFDTVDVVVLLLDSSGNVLGANSTVQRTLVAGEERAFVMEWPFAIPGVDDEDVVVTTNVFANDNFIRAYGSQERFQER